MGKTVKSIKTNSNSISARERFNKRKQDEMEKNIQETEDAKWTDDDKLNTRKQNRKNQKEEKKAREIGHKLLVKKLIDEELESINPKSPCKSPRVTRKDIEDHTLKNGPIGSSIGQTVSLNTKSIPSSPSPSVLETGVEANEDFVFDVAPNLNRLEDDVIYAKGIDATIEALQKIHIGVDDLECKYLKSDKPKILKFKEYKEIEMNRLNNEDPSLTFYQKEKLILKNWHKSLEYNEYLYQLFLTK